MNRRILIVEDDRKIARTISLYLEREGYEVLSAFDGQEALTVARAKQPALVVLDLMLPQLDGLEVCGRLRAESDVYIVILTAKSTEADKLRGLNTGADDYVTKPFSPRELVARVRAVLRRRDNPDRANGPAQLRFTDLLIDIPQHEAFIREQALRLTRKEFRLLVTFAKSPNRAFTRAELIERAFGYSYDGLDRTVDAHVMNPRRKIESGRFQAPRIVTVYGIGYKFSTDEDAS